MKDITKLKNKYKGQKVFVIGTGRSINDTDLNLIKDVTIGCNHLPRQYLPNYLCVSDMNMYKRHRREMDRYKTEKIFSVPAPNLSKEIMKKYDAPKHVRVPEDIYKIYYEYDKFLKDGDLWDFESLSYTAGGYTVILDLCLPLAYFMGFKTVYLLGVDFTGGGHFYDNHISDEPPLFADANLAGYKLVKEVFEADGRKIYNVTPHSRLNVFEKVNYVDVL